MSVTTDVWMFESLLLLNRLEYGNMNGTMLSQIVWVMFLAHQVYQKYPKIVKKAKSRFYDFLALRLSGNHRPASRVHYIVKIHN